LSRQTHAVLTDVIPTVGANIVDVLDHIPTALAFVSADTDFQVLYANHAFTRIFGYVVSEVKKISHWTTLVYPDADVSRSRFTSWQLEVEKAQQSGVPIPDRESHALCKDGTYRDVIVQTTLLNGLLLLTFTDITEHKRLAAELLEKEKQFRRFVENANDIIYTLDLEGNFTYMSPNTRHSIGWDPTELVGTHFKDIVHPSELKACMTAFGSALQGDEFVSVEYRVRKKDGAWSWQSSNVKPIRDASDQITAVIGVGRDITQRKQAEEKLLLSEARYRLLSDNARDVIWTLASDGSVTYVSPSVEQTRGYTPQEAMQQTIDQVLTPESVALNVEYLNSMRADLAAGRRPKPFRGHMEYLCKDGSTYWCEVMATPILAEDGSLLELLGVSRDITAHKKHESDLKRTKEATDALNRALEAANERLNRIATTDTLTGLWSRRHFEDTVEHEMAIANRYGTPLSALIFDIDHFKTVNDTHGHLAGDLVLVALSELARQHTRATDLACRWGGEEFMVLMPKTTATEAMVVAEKLRLAFENHEVPNIGKVTASFGVASYQPNESLQSWVSRTDSAMYEAKRAGRNTVRLG
jgi:diguanylate cyclase (GGDEF)-like protein/PAS domain S-box-containing protein